MTATQGPKLVLKLSAKTVIGNVRNLLPRDELNDDKTVKVNRNGESVKLMRVIGQCTGMKTGESQFGPWIAFTGSFQAIKMETGEIFRSGKIFLPEVAEQLLAPLVMEADGKAVEFAFDIEAKRDDSLAIGYIYEVTPLLEVAESDPMKALMERVGLPQLENKSAPEPQGNAAPAADAKQESGDKKAAKK